tara:strand:- start:75 stop:803 length:729 start_codon:yes stop_codon:yes gene_type:complete
LVSPSRKSQPKILFLFAFILVLSGCKLVSTTSIYTGDLIDVLSLSTGEQLLTKSNLKVEFSSEETCAQDASEFALLLRNSGVSNLQFIECYEEGFSSFGSFDIDIPVIRGDDENGDVSNTNIFGLVVMDEGYTSGEDALLSFYFCVRGDIWNNVQNASMDKYFQKFDVDDMDFIYEIENDLREPKDYYSGTLAFINSKPTSVGTQFTLKRRDSINVRMNDVSKHIIASSAGGCSLGGHLAKN